MAMEEVVEVQHVSHDHPLMLIKPEETHKDWDLTCFGCEQPISDSASHYYGCKRCVFLLHKTCAELPREMTHLSHPQHPLTFLQIPAYGGNTCDICRGRCNRFFYRCDSCDYDIDMKCALVVLSIQRSIDHTSHSHQLIPLQKESMFLCDACGTKHEGTSFLCTTCGFWINQKCASSPPKLRLNNDRHHHTLSLVYFFTQQGYDEYSCRICSERIYRRNWFYSCSQCDYVVHLRCAVNNGTEATELDSSNSVTAPSASDQVPILPRRDDSFDIITQFIKNTSEQGKHKEATEIKHICHDHPLTYFDFEMPIDQAVSRSMSDVSSLLGGERNAGKCDGCAQSISAPFYHCVECNFSLHVWCAELPDKLQHPGHPEHTLSLTMPKYYVECVGCHLIQNTMHYVCEKCAFFLDCKCASLPRVIKHEEHRHNLALRPTSNSKCISCGVTSTGISFECGGCKHYLCTRCVLFPRTVRHRYDKLHPFILNYSRTKDQTDDDFCEICEEEIINSNHWFYHCGECNQYLHKDCVFPLTSKKPYRLIDWDPSWQHQHRLARVELYEDLSCSLCKRNVHGDSRRPRLCPLCKFCLCGGCLMLSVVQLPVPLSVVQLPVPLSVVPCLSTVQLFSSFD